MTNETLTIVRGVTTKPVATDNLITNLLSCEIEGHLSTGYPVIASPDGPHTIDALLLSPQIGLVCFDLVEGIDIGDFQERQDNSFNQLSAKLLKHRELVQGRELLIDIHTITYTPVITDPQVIDEHPILNENSLLVGISNLRWSRASQEIYERTLSAIQTITGIRRANSVRDITNPKSRGAELLKLESSISTLDRLQSKAVIETIDGVQRIRGLAGSGKTIVLALKAAYLHAQHPRWKIAVTFNTRSLKDYFKKLINGFLIEQTGEEPNWDNLRVINSWGAPGSQDRDGIYHQFCQTHEIDYYNLTSARNRFGRDNELHKVVTDALNAVTKIIPTYDAILIDEAQDFSPAFLRLCYLMLKDPKRLVYAYDELQNLTEEGLPSVEEIFGSKNGKPLVTFTSETNNLEGQRDIILEKCYRNSRPVLVSAHGLGFGIYRNPLIENQTGLVQMFAYPELWKDIGYKVKRGQLKLGYDVTLFRTTDTSPEFLEEHSQVDDLIIFKRFENERAQAEWVAKQIQDDLDSGELRHNDIIVINTNPMTARSKLGVVRKALLKHGIRTHHAGVDTSPDVFYQGDSVTCTGIHRAKGNEAAMVYVINGNECHTSSANLSLVRNRLFTAITRSKAWVRVTGIGTGMDYLIEEYDKIRNADFCLNFKYPTQAELDHLKTIHRDISQAEKEKIITQRQIISDLIKDLKSGRIFPQDFDETDLKELRDLLD